MERESVDRGDRGRPRRRPSQVKMSENDRHEMSSLETEHAVLDATQAEAAREQAEPIRRLSSGADASES